MPVTRSGCKVTDYSSATGCRTRIVECLGWAEATDPERRRAIALSRDEAETQKKFAVHEAERDIHCPTGGCDGNETCRQAGRWYSGDSAGYRIQNVHKQPNGDWHARYEKYVERRLNCRCVDPTTVRFDPAEHLEDDFPDDDAAFV